MMGPGRFPGFSFSRDVRVRNRVWGEYWLPEDINDPGFGIAIGALPGESSGRAYVDSVEITIHFLPACPCVSAV